MGTSSNLTTGPRTGSDLPPPVEMLETVMVLFGGAAVAAPILPGFALCVPGLGILVFALLVPLLAVTVLVALAGMILAIPFQIVRSVRAVRRRRASHGPRSAPVLAADV